MAQEQKAESEQLDEQLAQQECYVRIECLRIAAGNTSGWSNVEHLVHDAQAIWEFVNG